MKLLNTLSGMILVVSLFLMPACKKDSKDDQSGTYYGPTASLGQGTIRSYVVYNGSGKPETVGLRFSPASLANLPVDSTKEWEYPVELPEQAKITGFDHLEVDWNPVGHEPKPIYGLPHFDFHFYRITKEEQAAVVPGPDTVSVPPIYIPQDYISGVIAVPDMGVHWVDSKAPEFTGQKFTDTFIYGFYHGQLTFMEGMATVAWIQTNPDFKIEIKQPKAFQKTGYYPTVSHIWYDGGSKEYVMAMEGLTWQVAN